MVESKPKLAIVGYGKMGKAIESLANEKNFIVTDIFDIDNPITSDKTYDFDVAIEFTTPLTVLKNIETIAKLKKNLVVGTTGWYSELDVVREIVAKEEIGLIYSPNFSIGVQLFFKIIETASNLINKFDDYDVLVEEIHHRHKLDAPSGTAKKLVEILINNIERKLSFCLDPKEKSIEKIQVASLRVGEIFGTHKAIFDSYFDTIEIIHNAKNRMGFAAGALLAASFIHNKKGFYEFGI